MIRSIKAVMFKSQRCSRYASCIECKCSPVMSSLENKIKRSIQVPQCYSPCHTLTYYTTSSGMRGSVARLTLEMLKITSEETA